MVAARTQTCARCAELQQQIAEREAEIARLRAQLAAAAKNSSTSSKPPSSDIVKPPKDRPHGGRKQRRRGGQVGHVAHHRPAFPSEQVDHTQDYTLDRCPDCGGPVEEADTAPRVVQQVEIPEIPLRIEEHRGLPFWCARCRRVHYAPLPRTVVQAGLVGPRLTALVAFLKGVGHASFSTIRKFLRDVVGVTISRGQLAKVVQKVSASLEATYDELLTALPHEARLNIDETGHPDQGQRLWTWCFRARLFTVFHIDASRGSQVLLAVLGAEFNGLIGCDYFSAYRKYMKHSHVLVQFCLAHLIRDVKFLVEHPDADNCRYGTLLLKHLRALFRIIHDRAYYTSELGFRLVLAGQRDRLVAAAFRYLPATREAQNLAQRFREHAASYFRFITEPDVDPTNNLAEQAIRFVALHRRMTQGTRGEKGQQWCERLWTVATTCGQQGRSVFAFLLEAVEAYFRGEPFPSLLPNSS
jgi:transposase